MALAEWLTKSGVQGTKEADFFLQCLASVFADCLAKDTKGREIMAVIICIAIQGLGKLDSS